MGAQTFMQYQPGEDVSVAWTEAKQQAYYEYGHRGYTGSLAEKDDYVVVHDAGLQYESAKRKALELIEQGDDRVDDKWGPAGAIRVVGGTVYHEHKNVEADGWLFFGWASS